MRSPPSRLYACGDVLGTCASARAIREARMIHRAASRHVVGMFLRKFLHRGAACLRLDGCEQQHSQDYGELHVTLSKPRRRILGDRRESIGSSYIKDLCERRMSAWVISGHFTMREMSALPRKRTLAGTAEMSAKCQ
jgi:hypothetical protein